MPNNGKTTRRVRRPGSKRQLRIVVWIFAVIAAAVGVSYFLLRPQADTFTLRDYTAKVVEIRTIQDYIQLGATVRARTEVTLRAPAAGILASINVDVGDWVKPGQVVAILDSENLHEALQEARSSLAQSSRNHANLLLTREQAVLIGSRQRANLVEILEQELTDLRDAEQLHKLGTITLGALENAKNGVESARKSLIEHDEDSDIATRFYELSRQGSDDSLATIRNIIVDLEQQVAETRMTASIKGQVVWTIDIIESVGGKVNENTPILQLADTRDPFIETVIEEQYASEISIGQEVAATIMGRRFPGYIERIGLLAVTSASGGAPQVDLDIRVEVSDIEVIPGSTALVEIIVGVVPDAFVLPRGPFLSTGNNLYLYKIAGLTAIRTRATFGAITEQYVEVASGVTVGDEIIISSYQNYIDFKSIILGGNND
jgi:HlyD family secretion protein